MTHVYISTPVHYAPEVEFVTSLMMLTRGLEQVAVSHTIEMPSGESLITRARNNAVARFLASDATHLLFIDSDQSFTTADVLRLLDAKKPIVGALIPKKQIDWAGVRAAAVAGVEDIEGHGANYVMNPGAQTVQLDGQCAPVDAVGTGFMLVERAVIEAIIAAHPEIAYATDDGVGEREPRWAVFDCAIDPETRRYLSEDYEFCRRARTLGFGVWLHIGVTDICHVGKHTYRGHVGHAFRLHREGA